MTQEYKITADFQPWRAVLLRHGFSPEAIEAIYRAARTK